MSLSIQPGVCDLPPRGHVIQFGVCFLDDGGEFVWIVLFQGVFDLVSVRFGSVRCFVKDVGAEFVWIVLFLSLIQI